LRTDYVPLELPPLRKIRNRVDVVFAGALPVLAERRDARPGVRK